MISEAILIEPSRFSDQNIVSRPDGMFQWLSVKISEVALSRASGLSHII